MDICLWTLSVTRREQFSEEKLKKLAVIRPLKTKLLYVQGQISGRRKSPSCSPGRDGNS